MRTRLPSSLAEERDAARPAQPRRSAGLAVGLRQALAAGYDGKAFRTDLLAGVVVGIVALPLSMALAIAVGVEPQHGLYTAIVAGAAVALTGGSRFQVTGPTAAFVVILAPIVSRHGLGGLLTAGLMAGVMLIAFGAAGLGRLIQYIPYPVTTGFTAGIAWVIATLQIKDVFGLPIARQPEGYLEKIEAYWHARGDAKPAELAVAAATFALLLLVPRLTRRIPAPLVAIVVVSAGCALLARALPGFQVATIGSRFSTTIGGETYAGIPPLPPLPMLPWGDQAPSLAYLRELLPAAFAIALLGAIESLLSAVIADGMTGTKHDSNAELVGLGIGNVLAPFFGGIAATGALARTATNVRSGAKSPVAAVVHAAVVLLSILLLARLVAFVPMASLAGLLLLVAWNMSEARHVVHVLRVAPKSDAAVLLVCFFLTVVFDMVVAVGVGVVLAALLFMRRMAELTHTREIAARDVSMPEQELPPGVSVYEIAGALFFGAARNATSTLSNVHADVRVLVVDLGRVPVIDVTGLVALEGMVADMARQQCRVILAGPLPEPRAVFDRAHLGDAMIVASRPEALELARRLVAEASDERTRRPHGSSAPPSPKPSA